VVQQLHAYLQPYLPEGVKALILDHDTEITVMSKAVVGEQERAACEAIARSYERAWGKPARFIVVGPLQLLAGVGLSSVSTYVSQRVVPYISVK
jgi:hypothetical protein